MIRNHLRGEAFSSASPFCCAIFAASPLRGKPCLKPELQLSASSKILPFG
jgi:hypothetical protein